jgi:hypothetical protein
MRWGRLPVDGVGGLFVVAGRRLVRDVGHLLSRSTGTPALACHRVGAVGEALLRGGPGDGQVVAAAGRLLVWRACLYEQTRDRRQVRGQDVPVYEHRPDCCEPYGHGNEDRCE